MPVSRCPVFAVATPLPSLVFASLLFSCTIPTSRGSKSRCSRLETDSFLLFSPLLPDIINTPSPFHPTPCRPTTFRIRACTSA
ncbi:hypothetical protein LX36DRAFT_662317 [Colletotrichum falcatum]|nr:hypothetical protein LX36DRAFT_662317 [Colletotrichum falcatum]